MKHFIVLLITISICSGLIAQAGPTKETEVLLLGTFHFANRGLDVAKFEDVKILSEKRQKEVEEMVAMLKKFSPDKIFIEVPTTSQKKYDSLYVAYKNGTHTLTGNETQQVGFRLAKECGLASLICTDYNNVSFPIDSVMKEMMVNKQMDMLQYFQNAIQREQNDFDEEIKTKTITQMLLDANTEKIYHKLVGVYYFFLKAGDKTNHAGSFLASEQWRRNMYIYENILKNLDGKEKRILVLYGTTHVAMLKEMMKYNESLKMIPVMNVLK